MRETQVPYVNALLGVILGGTTLAGICVFLGLAYAEGLLLFSLGFHGSPLVVFDYNDLLSLGGTLLARKLLLESAGAAVLALVIHRLTRTLGSRLQRTFGIASLILVVGPLLVIYLSHSHAFWKVIGHNYHGLPSFLQVYVCLLVLVALRLGEHPMAVFGITIPSAVIGVPAVVTLFGIGLSHGANQYLTTARPYGPATANIVLTNDSTIMFANLLSIHDGRVALGIWDSTHAPHLLLVEQSHVRSIEVTDAAGSR